MWHFFKLLKDNFFDDIKRDVGSIKNIVADSSVGNILQGTATPKTPLEAIEEIDDNSVYTSVGADGNLYACDGVVGIKYSEDGAKTWTKYEFPHTEYGRVRWVTKTHSGYIVICSHDSSDGGVGVYFSKTFDDGYILKFSFPSHSFFSSLNVDYYHGFLKGQQVVLVGEYGHTKDVERSLYGTFDGGETWKKLFTTEIKNASQNSHIHTAHYDRFKGRIYLGVGDYDNAGLYYSDDLGKSWTEIPVPENDVGKTRFQPTRIIATPNKILLGPDSDNIPVSVLSLPLKKYKLGNETFNELIMEYVITNKQAYTHYPFDHIIHEGVIYILYRGTSGDRQTFIVASGDYGETFHTVLSFKGEEGEYLFDNYLVGIDKNGYIYGRQGFIRNGSITVKNFKFKPVDWTYN